MHPPQEEVCYLNADPSPPPLRPPQEETVVHVSADKPSGKAGLEEPQQEGSQKETPSMASKVYQAAAGLVGKVEKAAEGKIWGEEDRMKVRAAYSPRFVCWICCQICWI